MATLTADITAEQEYIPDADLATGYYQLDSEMIRVRPELHATRDADHIGQFTVDGRYVDRRIGGTTAAAHSAGVTYTPVPDPAAPGGTGGGGVTVTGITGATVDPASGIRAANVTADGDTAVLSPVIISDTEPAPGAGQFWLRLMPDSDANSFQLYVRNGADDAWVQASAGVGAADFGDGFGDVAARQVGKYNGDPNDGNFIGLRAEDSRAVIMYTSADGNTTAECQVGNGIVIAFANDPTFISIQINSDGFQVFGLPTADPGHAGAFYTDGVPSAGVPKPLMVSGGAT